MPGSRKFMAIVAAVVTATTITVAGAGIAAASGSPATSSARPIAKMGQARPASTCHLWAVVNVNGTLARTGCPGATSGRLGVGAYSVLFPVNVRHCAYLATIGLAGSNSSARPGFITVVGRALHRNGVFVTTFNASGGSSGRPFHLIVAC